MAEYRWSSEEHISAIKYPGTSIVDGGYGWSEFQAYVDAGGEVDPYKTEADYLADNAGSALAQQDADTKTLAVNSEAVLQGLPAKLSADDIVALENNIQRLQGDIDRPSNDPGYQAPSTGEPTPPVYSSLTAEVTREPGWQGTLGYRFVLGGYDDGFVPGNLAMAVYSNPECDGYLYTTGAFVWDDVEQEWYAVCPAGQEPGDAAINFGMLNGATPISCFTLDQGVMQKIFNVYV